MATKKKPGTAVINWEADMAARAVKVAATEKVTSSIQKISTRGGILAVDDTPVEGNELRVVVIGAVHENQYYEGVYNPNVPAVPKCYSFSDPHSDDPESTMFPHAEAEAPEGAASEDDGGLEGANCGDCWANRMGTAEVGRGKACKNIRRLALITEDVLTDAASIADAEVRVLNVPVMSVKNWAKYAKAVADDFNRPYWGAVCTVKLVPDAKSQFAVVFKFEELIDFTQETYEAMVKLNATALESLVRPYPKMADLAAAAPQKMVPRGRVAAKAAMPAKKGKF
jgi:hypothetical protein